MGAVGEYECGSSDVPAGARTCRLVLEVSPKGLYAGGKNMGRADLLGTSYVVPLANWSRSRRRRHRRQRRH